MDKKITIVKNYNRLDRYIKKNVFLSIPQSLLEKYLRKGLITLNGKIATSKTKVSEGQQLFIDSSVGFTDTFTQAKHQVKQHVIKHDIIYQDQYVILLNKPSGLAVQGGSKVRVSVDDIIPDLDRVNNEMPRIVHRLDKDTSGILMLARTLESARFLANAFVNYKINKKYKAIVGGQISRSNGTIDVPLAKKVLNGQEAIVPSENGKKSITHFRVLDVKAQENITYLELHPVTGRKHQLRVHMQYYGHPICGDQKYGSGHKCKLCLHAYSINLTLPNNKEITITAPLPEHMSSIVTTDVC